MKKSSNKGFTLVELIIVIAILAIIMLIAIPNFSGIQQRMKVRADKSTAAQIGKAVRVWYTDYMSDKDLKALLVKDDDKSFIAGGNLVEYTELTGIEKYCATSYEPSSLLTPANHATSPNSPEPTQLYLVGLTSADASAGKVCVAIVNAAPTIANTTPYASGKTISDSAKVDYDGTSDTEKMFAYIEP